jgi:pimeloyl-ACP methyl ester carboxylesterase
MRRTLASISAIILICGQLACAQSNFAKPDPAKSQDTSPYTVRFVAVEPTVKLEVLDWGGTGRPLVFLAGLGATAHAFDKVAPELISKYRVYGITRRGFGASSAPEPTDTNYTADRLADDVLAVMADLQIEKPVLAGWSLGGEELSSIGTRHPEKVAGLIYIDAAYEYAYYDASAGQGALPVDTAVLRAELKQLMEAPTVKDLGVRMEHLQHVTLPRYENDLTEGKKQLELEQNTPQSPDTLLIRIDRAIEAGMEPYATVKCPTLALFANPHDLTPELRAVREQLHADPATEQAMIASMNERTTAQIASYRAGNPLARVVVIPNADHFLFKSNQEQVLSEMSAFIDKLPN